MCQQRLPGVGTVRRGDGTVKGDDAVLVEVGLVDDVLQLLGAGVQAQLAHDLAELGCGDIAWAGSAVSTSKFPLGWRSAARWTPKTHHHHPCPVLGCVSGCASRRSACSAAGAASRVTWQRTTYKNLKDLLVLGDLVGRHAVRARFGDLNPGKRPSATGAIIVGQTIVLGNRKSIAPDWC